MELLVTLQSDSNTPLHKQLYDEIRLAILSGRLPSGQKVPSTRTLSKSLGVSRATVTTAFDFLLSEGYLESFVGSGTYVCRELPDDILAVSEEEAEAIPTGISQVPTLSTSISETSSTQSPQKISQPKRQLSWYGESLQATDWMDFSEEEPEIQFTFGRPDLEHFPLKQWNQLVNQHSKRREFFLLDSPANAQGYEPLQQAIAAYLARSRAFACDPEQIIVVSGSQQAIALVTRVLVDRGDLVGLEDPGYIGAQRLFLAQGAHVIPIPVDTAGARLDELKTKYGTADNKLKLVYLTPSHQYPTGVVLSLSRRLDILNWAKKTETLIIEDDYDSEFRYKGRPIPALAGLDSAGSVIYMGTFSKILLPSLRLGYIVVPHDLVEVFRRAKWLADRHSPLLEQQVLADFINQGHMERHVRRMKRLYEQKRKVIIKELKKNLGKRVTIFGDNAGIHVLVRIESRLNDAQIVERCWKLGVGVSSTRKLYLSEPQHSGEFMLNYGSLTEEEIESGIAVLAKVIEAKE